MHASYDSLVGELLERFPELRLRYEEERAFWGAEAETVLSPHIVFGDLFATRLVEALEAGGDVSFIERAFTFLEEMLEHPQTIVGDVAGATVLERVADDPRWVSTALPYLKPKARACLRQIVRDWGMTAPEI